MRCSNCQHNWCWSCGYREDHFFHIFGDYGGLLCEAFNELAVSNVHPFFQWLIIILFSVVLPAAALVAMVLASLGFGIGASTECCGRCLRGHRNCCMKLLLVVLFLPFGLVISAVVAALCLALGSVVYGLAVVPVYLFILTWLLRIMYLWCLKSKRTRNRVIMKR